MKSKIDNINNNKVVLEDQTKHINNLFVLKNNSDKKILDTNQEIESLKNENNKLNTGIENIKKKYMRKFIVLLNKIKKKY